MAFARIAFFPGGTQDSHQAVADGLGDAHTHADGRILFASGPVDGGWQIVQVWESRANLEAWVEAHLGEAFAKAGSRGHPNPPTVTDFELYDVMV